MSSVVDLQPEELRRFSVPLTLRLIGERQYLLGAGSFVIATDMRLSGEVEETPDAFALSFVGRPDAADLAAGWQAALGAEALGDESALEGLSLTVDFGDLFDVCPAEVLLTSPALAAALTAAALAHRAEGASMTAGELAGRAASVLCAVTSGGREGADRFYADALTSIAGGTGYIEPGGERINVQQLLPVESFTLALVPQAKADGAALAEQDRRLRETLDVVRRAGVDIMGASDAGLGALFGLGDLLDEWQTTMLYGLLRVREMMDVFLEHLGEPFVDNDRLAEICDEESAILSDYFGFPADLYRGISAGAGEAGALGCKFTWAFGSCPAAVIVAPGRRNVVNKALVRRFPTAHFLPVNMQVEGLLPLDEGGEAF